MNFFSKITNQTFFVFTFCTVILTFSATIMAIPSSGLPNNLPKPGEMVLSSKKDIPRHLWVADNYLQAGKFKDVISISKQVLKMSTNNIEAHALLAAAYKGLNKEDKFQGEVYIIDQLAPDSPALHISLAKTYVHLKEIKKAEDSYIKGIKLAKDKTKFRIELGTYYLKNEKLQEASDQFLLALEKKGIPMAQFITANYALCNIWMQNKAYDGVIKRASMIVDLYPPIEQSYNYLAYAYIGKENPKKAIEVYELLRKNNPNSSVPYQEIALIYSDKLNNNENALKYAKEGSEKFPNIAKSQDVYGWVLYENRKFNEAINFFKKAHELAPADPSYIYHLGLAFKGSGEKSKALSMFNLALENVDRKKQENFVKELEKLIADVN